MANGVKFSLPRFLFLYARINHGPPSSSAYRETIARWKSLAMLYQKNLSMFSETDFETLPM